jgi:hypothetical protein
MRTFLMRVLTLAMCGAAILTFGVAQAGDREATRAEPQFTVLEPDARIAFSSLVNGFEVVDDDTILLRVGASRLYLAELSGPCGRHARWEHQLGIAPNGPGIDTFSSLVIDGRRCRISSLTRVERAPDAAPAAG